LRAEVCEGTGVKFMVEVEAPDAESAELVRTIVDEIHWKRYKDNVVAAHLIGPGCVWWIASAPLGVQHEEVL
jgi:hypothetical protein